VIELTKTGRCWEDVPPSVVEANGKPAPPKPTADRLAATQKAMLEARKRTEEFEN
jgi:hypothetical protein